MDQIERAAVQADVDWEQVARLVLRSRLLDEREESELAAAGEVPYQFSSKGHELAQVLMALQLTHPHDAAGVYYRSRAFMLAAGLTLKEALAAGMGKSGSPSEGRDVGVVFSMPPRGGPTVLPASGDVGAQFTPTAGWAQAIRYRAEVLGEEDWKGAAAVALGGDGSVAANGFWSAITMATTLNLPHLILIEDNRYGISVPSRFQTPGGDITANLAAFSNLFVLSGSGTDPEETGLLVTRALAHVRSGQGPCLLRLEVPRLSGHTFIDNQAYKSEEERQREAEADPLLSLEGLLGPERVADLREEAAAELEEALAAARQLPASAEPPGRHVFFDGMLQQVGGAAPDVGRAEGGPTTVPPRQDGPRINLLDAVKRVLEETLEDNPRAMVFGEDVGAKGGVHGATLGLQTRFGPNRVFDTSLSEEGIIGRSTGMALAGLLPIPELQFRKYADPAVEQLKDLGTIRWRTAGKFGAPVVVRIPVGFSKKIGDPWHSVTGEAVYAHWPGWRLVFPSNAADAAGLLRTALRGEDPTFFFEHRALLDSASARRPYPGPEYLLPFGQAAVLREGDELTLVTWGAMVHASLEAARNLDAGIEVLDLRTIVPWDREAVLRSVKKTGRLLVVHEDSWTSGFGGEIVATVGQQGFMDLDAPPRRLAMPDCPVPYSADLMSQIMPDTVAIEAAMRELLEF